MTPNLFKRVSALRFGYDCVEVDAFFDQARAAYEGEEAEPVTIYDVQSVVFDVVRRGYNMHEVDAALDRLEVAFVGTRRTDVVAALGQDAWNAELAKYAQTLYERLGRPEGERFAPAPRGAAAYDCDDVDDLCQRLTDYFSAQVPLTSEEIRSTTFRRRKGAKGYDEATVDVFLRRASEVLLSVE